MLSRATMQQQNTNIPASLFKGFWTREDTLRHKDALFIFGDNLKREGTEGQACIRGEPNAAGLATKIRPKDDPGDFFSDDRYKDCCEHIDVDLRAIIRRFKKGGYKCVVLPEDHENPGVIGLGTGLSKLPKKAPRVYKHLLKREEQYFNVTSTMKPVNVTKKSVPQPPPDSPLEEPELDEPGDPFKDPNHVPWEDRETQKMDEPTAAAAPSTPITPIVRSERRIEITPSDAFAIKRLSRMNPEERKLEFRALAEWAKKNNSGLWSAKRGTGEEEVYFGSELGEPKSDDWRDYEREYTKMIEGLKNGSVILKGEGIVVQRHMDPELVKVRERLKEEERDAKKNKPRKPAARPKEAPPVAPVPKSPPSPEPPAPKPISPPTLSKEERAGKRRISAEELAKIERREEAKEQKNNGKRPRGAAGAVHINEGGAAKERTNNEEKTPIWQIPSAGGFKLPPPSKYIRGLQMVDITLGPNDAGTLEVPTEAIPPAPPDVAEKPILPLVTPPLPTLPVVVLEKDDFSLARKKEEEEEKRISEAIRKGEEAVKYLAEEAMKDLQTRTLPARELTLRVPTLRSDTSSGIAQFPFTVGSQPPDTPARRRILPLEEEQDELEKIAKSTSDFVFVKSDKSLDDKDTVFLGDVGYHLPTSLPTDDEFRAHALSLLEKGVSWADADKQMKIIKKQISNYKARVKKRQAGKTGIKGEGKLAVLASEATKKLEKEKREKKKEEKEKERRRRAEANAKRLTGEKRGVAWADEPLTEKEINEARERQVGRNKGEGAVYEKDEDEESNNKKMKWRENAKKAELEDRILIGGGFSSKKEKAMYEEYVPQDFVLYNGDEYRPHMWSYWNPWKLLHKARVNQTYYSTFWTSEDWHTQRAHSQAVLDFRELTRRTLEYWGAKYVAAFKGVPMTREKAVEWLDKQEVPWVEMEHQERREFPDQPNRHHVTRLDELSLGSGDGRINPFLAVLRYWEADVRHAFAYVAGASNDFARQWSIPERSQLRQAVEETSARCGAMYALRLLSLLKDGRRLALKAAGVAPWKGMSASYPVEFTEQLEESAKEVAKKYSEEELAAVYQGGSLEKKKRMDLENFERENLEEMKKRDLRLVYVQGKIGKLVYKEEGVGKAKKKVGKLVEEQIPPLSFIWVFSAATENDIGFYERKLSKDEKSAMVPYKAKPNPEMMARYLTANLKAAPLPDTAGREGFAKAEVLRSSFLRDVDMTPIDRMLGRRGGVIVWNPLVPFKELKRRPGVVIEANEGALVPLGNRMTSRQWYREPRENQLTREFFRNGAETEADREERGDWLELTFPAVGRRTYGRPDLVLPPEEEAEVPPAAATKLPVVVVVEEEPSEELAGGAPEAEAPNESKNPRIVIEEIVPLGLYKVVPDTNAAAAGLIRRGLKRRPGVVEPVSPIVEIQTPPAPEPSPAPSTVAYEPLSTAASPSGSPFSGEPLEPLFLSPDSSVPEEIVPILSPLKRRPGGGGTLPVTVISPVSSVGDGEIEEPLLEEEIEGPESPPMVGIPPAMPPSPQDSPMAAIPPALAPLKRRPGKVGTVLPVVVVEEEPTPAKIVSKKPLARRARQPSPSLEDAFMEDEVPAARPAKVIKRRPGQLSAPLSVRRAIANGAEVVPPHRPHEPYREGGREPYRKRSDSFAPNNVYLASDGKVRPHTVPPALKAFSNPQLDMERRNYKRKMEMMISAGRR